jgi:hypothetical protein
MRPNPRGLLARDQYRTLKKVVVRLTPSYDPIPAQTHSWLVLRAGNETSPLKSWNRPRVTSRCHLRERRGARQCGRQAGSGGGADKEEEDGREASTVTPPGGEPPKSIPSRCHLLLAAAVDNFKSYSRSSADRWSVLLP